MENTNQTQTQKPNLDFIQELVDKLILERKLEPKQALINELATKVIQHRTSILSLAWSRRSVLMKELDNIKPDMIAYDHAGNLVNETFSKPQFNKLKNAKSNLERLEKEIQNAIENNQFDKLDQLVREKKEDDKKDDKKEDSKNN